jgi:hypothetical protein
MSLHVLYEAIRNDGKAHMLPESAAPDLTELDVTRMKMIPGENQ